MLSRYIYAVAAAAGSTLATSNNTAFFLLASTADVPAAADSLNLKHAPPVSDIHHNIWCSLASCPTKHYAVIIEPPSPAFTTAQFAFPNSVISSTFLSDNEELTGFTAENIHGKVDITAVVNTILMDCLHHGITLVQELDITSITAENVHEPRDDYGTPQLPKEVVESRIIYVVMPNMDFEPNIEEYELAVQSRRDTIQRGIIEKYFNRQGYTLIYVKEEEDSAPIRVQFENLDATESPLVAEDKRREKLK